MIKIKKISLINSCTECDFYEKYTGHEDSGFIVTACKKTGHAISGCIDKKDGNDYVEIPNWCPLETYNNTECKKPKTVILNGLEWMSDNLTGHGGTEIDDNWYYTWEQAMKAAEEVGDGWRLPTREEFETLINGESVWDVENSSRRFGGKMSLKAAGFLYNTSNTVKVTGLEGNYWGCSVDLPNVKATYLCFHSTYKNNYVANCSTGAIWFSCSVRLVRDIKK